MTAREPETLGGLTVTSLRGEGRAWYVVHAGSGLDANGGMLRQRRFAEEARAELLATGVDFTQDAKAVQAQRERWSEVYYRWRRRAQSTKMDVETGEYYGCNVNYGTTLPSAARAAAYRVALAEVRARGCECCESCISLEALARSDERVVPDDVCVPMTEVKAIEADFAAHGTRYNGMTSDALTERYGDRVYHVRGVGWFVRPEAVMSS